MSADSFAEIKIRLEDLIETIQSIRYDWYRQFNEEQEEELQEILNTAKEELEKL